MAIESANKALSIFDLNPDPFSNAFWSSALKIPVRRPVPIKVPSVSNVSDKLNAKIVINTNGIFELSENSESIPFEPNATPNVCPNCPNDSPNPALVPIADKSTTPIGIPIIVVAAIPIIIAPLTFNINKTVIIASPITASKTPGVLKLTKAGTALLFATTVPLSSAVYVPGSDVKLINPAFLTPIYAMNIPIPPPIAF